MEKFEEIVLKEKERSLHISRIPKNTKEGFVKLAEDEFCGDFGMTIKYLFDNFSLWKLLFENMDYKLDNILEIISQLEKEEQTPENTIRMINGEKRVKGGKK